MSAGHDLAEDTLAVVLAGGKGTRLGSLTRHVCKPALPFGAAYRNIDFTLSNCVNSGIRRIGIATQHNSESLHAHIDRVWNSALTVPGGFLEAWPAEICAPAGGYRGTADAVFRNLGSIRQAGTGLVLVLAGDHVYRMDYRPMLAAHRQRGADVTVGCVEVSPQEASQFGVASVDRHGGIEEFIEKPQSMAELPTGHRVLASMGIYVFETAFLDAVLRRDAFSTCSRHDFGADILPGLISTARTYAYRFTSQDADCPAYWRDVGTPAAYWRAHLELLDGSPSLRLNDPRWPLPVAGRAPRFTAQQPRSLIADGCEISGTVHRSVLFSDVQVAPGASIESSVVLPGAAVGRNCRLNGVVVDSHCRIPDGVVIDARRQFGGGGNPQEPVVVTPEDFVPDLARSIA